MTTERQFSTAKIVERIDKRFSALIWENFLKLLANGDKEDRARTYLQQKLQGYLVRQPAEFHAPLLQTPEEDTAELDAFLKGKLKPKKSKIWPLLKKIEGSEDDAEYEESLEVRRLYFETKEKIDAIIDSNNNLLGQLSATKEELRPLIDKLKFTPDEYELERQFKASAAKIIELRKRLKAITEQYKQGGEWSDWGAQDNLRQNPHGVRDSAKWATKILEKLFTINAGAEELTKILQKIRIKLKDIGVQTTTEDTKIDQT